MNDVFIKIIEVYRKAFCYKGVADCERYFFFMVVPTAGLYCSAIPILATYAKVRNVRSWHQADG